MEYILIFISAIFVNNIVLSQFLGICPFLGVSKKIDTALGMGGAVAFVLTLSTVVIFLVQKYVLEPFSLEYLQTLAFILVIASLVQMVEIILKKVSPSLYQALGIFLPLITTNSRVGGVCVLYGNRLRPRPGSVCRHPRTTGVGQGAQGHERHGYRHGYRRFAQSGFHGILGCGWRTEDTLRTRLSKHRVGDSHPMTFHVYCIT